MLTTLLSLLIAVAAPEDYGAKGECKTNDRAAFEAMLSDKAHARYELKAKCYFVDGKDCLNIQGIMVGEGMMASTIRRPPGACGLRVTGGFAQLEHFGVTAPRVNTGTIAHGIVVVRGRATLQNVYVSGFDGNCIDIDAAVHRGSNGNLWNVSQSRATNCRRWGIHTQGGDANAGYLEQFDATNNGAGCYLLSDFLGSTEIAGHCNGYGDCGDEDPKTTCGILIEGDNARHVMINQYVEGHIPIKTNMRSLLIGHIGGVVQPGSGPVLGAGALIGPWRYVKTSSGGVALHVNTVANAVQEWINPVRPQSPFRWQWELNEPGYWSGAVANKNGGAMINNLSDDIPAGSWVFPHGVFTGAGTLKNRVQHTSGLPRTGVYRTGDLLVNRSVKKAGDCGAWIVLRGGDARATEGALKPTYLCVPTVAQ